MDVRTIVAGIATDGAEDPLLEPALRLGERTGAARWLLGSVAKTVLRGAPGSVLVIPPALQGAPVPAHA